MHFGKKARYDRLVNPVTGKTVLIPFDHGLPFGPLPGITDPRKTVRGAVEGGANGVIFNQGLAEVLFPEYNTKIGVIHMLTNSATAGYSPRFGSVEQALRWAADAVAVEISVGSAQEGSLIEKLAEVVDACEQWNIPLLTMMYPTDDYVESAGPMEAIRHAARAGAELGATIVKTAWAGSKENMAKVVESCPVPLVVAGGSKKTVEETFQLVRDSIDVGAIGIAMGRNLWGSENPAKLIKAMSAVVHEGAGVKDAMAMAG